MFHLPVLAKSLQPLTRKHKRLFLGLIFFAFFFSVTKAQTEEMKRLEKLAKACNDRNAADSAIRIYRELIELTNSKDSTSLLFKYNLNLGNLYNKSQEKDAALGCYYNALRNAEKLNAPLQKASVLVALAKIHYEEKNMPEAMKLFREELQCRSLAKDTISLCFAYMNLSSVFRRQNLFDSSFLMIEKAQQLLKGKNISAQSAHLRETRAAHFFHLFNQDNVHVAYRDSAEFNWMKAMQIWKLLGRSEELIQPLFNLGFVHYSKKEYKKALTNYLEVKRIVDSTKQHNRRLTVYGNLGELYYDMGEFKNAADLFRAVYELKDSMQKDETRKYGIELERRYQFEKKDKKIIEQQLKIAEQQKHLYLYILISIILFVAALSFFVYYTFNKRLTKKIEEAKARFFSNVIHEIKTPLSMIQAPLKALKPKLTDQESSYYLNLADRNIGRLNELIGQMLDVSKVENDNYVINKSFGDLKQFLQDLCLGYEKLAQEKQIHFISDLQVLSGFYKFDRDALEKIFNNLVSNALKYTPAGGSAGITLIMDDTENNIPCHIEVWDTGYGIPLSEQNKVFNRFYRSERTAEKTSGVGIGLSYVRQLVLAHEGKISFKSEVNKGTTFNVDLTFEKSEAETTVLQSNSGELPVILLIEDDEDVYQFITTFLTSNQHSVIRARNGREGIALLDKIAPDMIITDLMMKEMDGLSFIHHLRGNKGLDHIPVIVLSAKSSPQTRTEVLEAGAQVFMQKPFLPEELLNLIRAQMGLLIALRQDHHVKIESHSQELDPETRFSSQEPYTNKFYQLIFSNLDNSDLTVELLADMMATNRSHFQRKIKKLTGYSPSEIIRMIRLEKAKEYLKAKKGNVTEVAYMTGFSSQSYFTKCFTQHFGHSPSHFNESS